MRNRSRYRQGGRACRGDRHRPNLLSVEVLAAGNRIVFTFDDAIFNTNGVGGIFTAIIAFIEDNLFYLSGHGTNQITFTVATVALANDEVTVSLSSSTTAKDAAGNFLLSFTDFVAVNNSTQT